MTDYSKLVPAPTATASELQMWADEVRDRQASLLFRTALDKAGYGEQHAVTPGTVLEIGMVLFKQRSQVNRARLHSRLPA